MLSYTQAQTLYTTLSLNTSAANQALGSQLMNIEHRYLLQKYFDNEDSYSTVTVANQQFYKLPPNYSKLKTLTITIGNLTWTPDEVLTREEWDKLNVFPYYSDIPSRFFIYNSEKKVGIWPIPSSNGNVITYNYKLRVPDLSVADYTTPGTVSITTLTAALTGSGTSFALTTNAQLESRWIQFAPTASSSTSGDNLWYRIQTVDSATGITLFDPYQGTTITASGSFTIGQMPLLQEDFHDMLVWKALVHYYTSIVDNPRKREEYDSTYKEKLAMLDKYAGSKTVHVNLARRVFNQNPNLFPQTLG